jgi:antitoxin component YwqK of YwqJK toxin-antitoxin module
MILLFFRNALACGLRTLLMAARLFLVCIQLSCTQRHADNKDLMTVVLQDRNGFSETISQPDRLERLSKQDFESPQPYQKVIRVFARTTEGSIPSILTTYHPNGQLHHYLEVRSGRALGRYQQYFPEGQLKIESQVTGGVPDLTESAMATWLFDGEARVYHANGQLEARIPYCGGIIHGLEERFHANGQRASSRSFVRGALSGPSESWSASGKLIQKQFYADNKFHGPAEAWDQAGRQLASEQWVDGRLVYATYPQYGAINLPTALGVERGFGWRPDYEHDQLIGASEVVDGYLEGQVLRWTPSGHLERKWEQRHASKHGCEQVFDPQTGRLRLEMTWEEGALSGTCRSFDPSGAQESQWDMLANQRHGRFIAWYRNGQVMLLEEYDQGRLMRGEYFERGSMEPISRVENGFGSATIFNLEGRLRKVISIQDGKPIP